MLRSSLLTVSLFLTACGIDPAIPAVQADPLVAALPLTPAQTERLVVSELTPRLQLAQLTAVVDRVSVHSLAVPDGTQVRYLLGMMGCGISVVGKGTATVQGGAFEIPYDPALSEFGVSLFFQIDQAGTGLCDPETSQVFEVAVALPTSVDLSVLPEQSFIGCWLFETGSN